MDLTSSDKTAVLLQLLQHQLGEIERRESREQKLFEWSTGLLAAAFGVVVALYDEESPLAHAKTIQILATVLVAVPTLVLIIRIRRYQKMSIENAMVVERLEKLLLLFDRGVYGRDSPYPKEWEGSFATKRLKRSTPFYYQVVSVLMAACVIGAIWLLLGYQAHQ